MNEKLRRRALALSVLPLLALGAEAQEQSSAQEQTPAAVQAYDSQCRSSEKPLTPKPTQAAETPVSEPKQDCKALQTAAQVATRQLLEELCAAKGLEACQEDIDRLGSIFSEEQLKELKANLALAKAPRKAALSGSEKKAADKGFEGLRDALASTLGVGGLNRLFDNGGAKQSPLVIAAPSTGKDPMTPAMGVRQGGAPPVMPGDRPLDAFQPPAPRADAAPAAGPSAMGTVASYAWGGTKRLLHACGAVVAMPFAVPGIVFRVAAGVPNLVAGLGERAVGGLTQYTGRGGAWLGDRLGSKALSSFGKSTEEWGSVISGAGGLTAAHGETLLAGALANTVNAVGRPLTVLVNPEYKLLSTGEGRYGRLVAGGAELLLDRNHEGQGKAIAALGDDDRMQHSLIDQASRMKNPVEKYVTYGAVLTWSAAEKLGQALWGGGALRQVGGTALQMAGVGSMAVGTAEQMAQHAHEIGSARGPQEKEAAVVKTGKSLLDLTAMLAGGSKAKEGEQGVPASVEPAVAPTPAVPAARGFWDRLLGRSPESTGEAKADSEAPKGETAPNAEPAPAQPQPAAVAAAAEPVGGPEALGKFRSGGRLSAEEKPLVLAELERWVGLARQWGKDSDVEAAQADLARARAALGGEEGPRFLTRQEAGSLVGAAEAQLRNLKQKLADSGGKPLTPEEEWRAYHVFLDEFAHPANHPPQKAPGGIGIFDNDSGLTARGADARWLGERGIVVDHHGEYYDTANPEVNTTMKVLGSIEKGLAESGDPQRVVADLRRQYPNISSDNVGDFGWTNWILRNPERVAQDPALRSLIGRATHYEDFGFFGEKARQAAGADPAAAEAQQLQHAVFRVYDEAMQRQGLAGSDRFPDLHPTRQRAMLAEVEKGMTLAVDDLGFREAKAQEFQTRMQDAQRQVEAARFGLDDASRASLAQAGVPASALDGVFIYDASKIKADGIFAGWGAAPQSHGAELLLGVRPMGGRTGFIYSVPNGMDSPALTSVGAALRAVEAAKDVGGDKPGNVGGRDALQFSFDGLHMTPQELLMEVAKARAEAAGKAAAEPPSPVLPREQKPSGLQGRLQDIRGRQKAAARAEVPESMPDGLALGGTPLRTGVHKNVLGVTYDSGGRTVEAALKVDARPSEADLTWKASQVPLPPGVHVTKVLAAEKWDASTMRKYGLEGKVEADDAQRYIDEGRVLMLMDRLPEGSKPLNSFLLGHEQGTASPGAQANLLKAVQALNERGIIHGDLETTTNVRWDPATDEFYILDFGNGRKTAGAAGSTDMAQLKHVLWRWGTPSEN